MHLSCCLGLPRCMVARTPSTWRGLVEEGTQTLPVVSCVLCFFFRPVSRSLPWPYSLTPTRRRCRPRASRHRCPWFAMLPGSAGETWPPQIGFFNFFSYLQCARNREHVRGAPAPSLRLHGAMHYHHASCIKHTMAVSLSGKEICKSHIIPHNSSPVAVTAPASPFRLGAQDDTAETPVQTLRLHLPRT